MPVICLHTSTTHCSPAGRLRLLREAQEILSDRCAPESRKQLAAAFILSNPEAYAREILAPLIPVPTDDGDGPRAA